MAAIAEFLVARGNATKPFDPVEEALDEMASFVRVGVEIAWTTVSDASRNVRFSHSGADRLARGLGRVALVGHRLRSGNPFWPTAAFDAVPRIGTQTAGPTYAGIYQGTWLHPASSALP